MGIKKDQSKVPTVSIAPVRHPDPEPRFVTALAEAWHQEYSADGKDGRAFAIPGTRWRASWAGGCARKVAYEIDHADAKREFHANIGPDADQDLIAVLVRRREKTKPSNPPTVADLWRMNLGTMVHDALEQIFPAAFPDAEIEVSVDLRPDIDGSATSDIIVHDQGKTTVVELKTKNGFGFKLAASTFKGAPQGPSSSHVRQAAVLAHAIGADEMVIGYLAMENLSPQLATSMGTGDLGRFAAEWTYSKEEFTPFALAEHKRVGKVIDLVDHEGPAGVPRAIEDEEIPKEARIIDPSQGRWEVVGSAGTVIQVGRTWYCGYCNYQDRCIADG